MYKFTHKLSYSTLILSLKKLSSNRKIHHFLVVYILSLAISFLLALNPVFSLASELPKAWQKFATLNQDTREIYTIFSQEKYFAFLKKPLRSAGELYFAKGSKNNFTLLWAYNKPLVSGFYYKDEQIWLLDPQKPHFRLAKNQEKQAISGAINTILPWMTGDIKLVSQKFNLAAGQDENSFAPKVSLEPQSSFLAMMPLGS